MRYERKALKKPFTAWIAISAYGYPAWFLGYYQTRKGLVAAYEEKHGPFQDAGYRAVRVRVEAA